MSDSRRITAILPANSFSADWIDSVVESRLEVQVLDEARAELSEVVWPGPQILIASLSWIRSVLPDPGRDPVATLKALPELTGTRVFLIYPVDYRGNIQTLDADDLLPSPIDPCQFQAVLKRIVSPAPKILFADENEGIGNIMQEAFKSQPVEFLKAGDSQKALEILRSEYPRLVFLDMNLAPQSGYSVLKALREDPYLKRTNVIMTSDTVDVETVEDCLNLGVMHFVMKPYDESELLLMAEFFLGRLEKRSQTVMIVDDSPVQLKLIQEYLERENFRVLAFTDARKALEAARESAPDLITADYYMPGMDGWEFCRELKLSAATRDIPVVMVSSGSSELSYRKARILKVDDYVTKPFTEYSLNYTINSVLLKRRFKQDETTRLELERELNLGITIQSGMLPANQGTSREGLHVEAWWEPARQLGGDFFDYVLDVRQREHFLAVADVSGKGLSSALMATAGIASLRSAAAFTTSTAHMLHCLNQFVSESSQPDRFITCFAALLKTDSKTLHYSSAGHNGMYLYQNSGNLLDLSARGLPCGMTENEEYEQKELAYEPGERLILFSDGVFEATNSKQEFYGRERFEVCIQSNSHLSGIEFFEALKKDVLEFAGDSERHDDITLLVADLP